MKTKLITILILVAAFSCAADFVYSSYTGTVESSVTVVVPPAGENRTGLGGMGIVGVANIPIAAGEPLTLSADTDETALVVTPALANETLVIGVALGSADTGEAVTICTRGYMYCLSAAAITANYGDWFTVGSTAARGAVTTYTTEVNTQAAGVGFVITPGSYDTDELVLIYRP